MTTLPASNIDRELLDRVLEAKGAGRRRGEHQISSQPLNDVPTLAQESDEVRNEQRITHSYAHHFLPSVVWADTRSRVWVATATGRVNCMATQSKSV